MDWLAHLIRDWFNLTDQQMQDVLDYIEAHREAIEADITMLNTATLSAQQIANYHENGYLIVRNVLSPVTKSLNFVFLSNNRYDAMHMRSH